MLVCNYYVLYSFKTHLHFSLRAPHAFPLSRHLMYHLPINKPYYQMSPMNSTEVSLLDDSINDKLLHLRLELFSYLRYLHAFIVVDRVVINRWSASLLSELADPFVLVIMYSYYLGTSSFVSYILHIWIWMLFTNCVNELQQVALNVY